MHGLLPAQEALPAPRWIGLYDMKGKVGLKWIPDPRYVSIGVYRRLRDGSREFELITETGEAHFVDSSVLPGKSYVYRLVATGSAGERSDPSPERSVSVTRPVRKGVTAPRWEGYLPVEEGVGLKWSRKEDEAIIAFNIYRRISTEKEFQLLASTTGSSYRDLGLEEGQEYVYVLTALGADFKESPTSTELTVTYARLSPRPEEKAPPAWTFWRTRLVKVASTGEGALSRPADVAVGPLSGQVYMVDSAAGTIEVFDRNGIHVRTIGRDEEGRRLFGNLLGIDVDDQEQIYVTDSAEESVSVLSSGGGILRKVRFGGEKELERTGLIDVAALPGRRAYVVDNFGNRVFLLNDRRVTGSFGETGTDPGKFSAPTFCTVDGEGRVYISDALNGRIQVFDAEGGLLRAFGRFSQSPGGFGRPKGVAVSRRGEVFVADSWLNVIQVFSAEGEFLGVLADESGKVLDLGSPNGIAVDGEDRIFIAERLSGRLQIRDILHED